MIPGLFSLDVCFRSEDVRGREPLSDLREGDGGLQRRGPRPQGLGHPEAGRREQDQARGDDHRGVHGGPQGLRGELHSGARGQVP